MKQYYEALFLSCRPQTKWSILQFFKTSNTHEKITQFWTTEKGVQFFCNTSAKLVTRAHITNGFWLAENTKETTVDQSDFRCFNNKIKENGHGLCKQWFDFVRKTTIEKLKKKHSRKPEHGKKDVFLAKCIENTVLREKYCQQKRRKWARETKQAAYNRLR